MIDVVPGHCLRAVASNRLDSRGGGAGGLHEVERGVPEVVDRDVLGEAGTFEGRFEVANDVVCADRRVGTRGEDQIAPPRKPVDQRQDIGGHGNMPNATPTAAARAG